jgi:hypothetical protein
MPCSHWTSAGDHQWNPFGGIAAARLAVGDSILLPATCETPFHGCVARFAERFTECLVLGFYDYLAPDMMPEAFCSWVGGKSGEYGILCPGVARSARA